MKLENSISQFKLVAKRSSKLIGCLSQRSLLGSFSTRAWKSYHYIVLRTFFVRKLQIQPFGSLYRAPRSGRGRGCSCSQCRRRASRSRSSPESRTTACASRARTECGDGGSRAGYQRGPYLQRTKKNEYDQTRPGGTYGCIRRGKGTF